MTGLFMLSPGGGGDGGGDGGGEGGGGDGGGGEGGGEGDAACSRRCVLSLCKKEGNMRKVVGRARASLPPARLAAQFEPSWIASRSSSRVPVVRRVRWSYTIGLRGPSTGRAVEAFELILL